MNQHANHLDRIASPEVLSPLLILLPPVIITMFMWLTSVNPVTFLGIGCSHLVLQLVWGSYVLWKRQGRASLPVFSMIGMIYWIFFAVALFWGGRILSVARLIPVSEEGAADSMAMAFAGVVCMFAGMRIPFRWVTTKMLPSITENAASSWLYVRLLMVVGTLASLVPSIVFVLGANGRNVMVILLNVVPMVAFLLLLRRCLTGTASPVDKPLVIAAGLMRFGNAIAGGWLGSALTWAIAGAALYLVLRRRIPWAAVLFGVASILFLQVGKQAFRNAYWTSGNQGADETRSGVWDRAQFWFEASAAQWSDALRGEGLTPTNRATAAVVERASLLTQVAHVVEVTPSQLPFQQGSTYSYVLVALIPRFLWPDKPTVNDANRYYQLAYGLSDAKSVNTTSIAVGSMAEGYINFGWMGVVGVMVGIGAVLKIYERAFFVDQSNALVLCIGVALIPQLLAIEGQLGQYLGGVVQQVGLAFLAFLPITMHRSRKVSAPSRLATASMRVRSLS